MTAGRGGPSAGSSPDGLLPARARVRGGRNRLDLRMWSGQAALPVAYLNAYVVGVAVAEQSVAEIDEPH